MPWNSTGCDRSRRGFLKRSALVAGGISLQFPMNTMAQAVADAVRDVEVKTWSACVINCGNRCPLQVVSKNGQVIRIEPENTGVDSCSTAHLRACVRGRSIRQRLYAPERLKYPMKRVGLRGEGKFERISWDEALDIVAAKLKSTIATYGNEAVYYNYGSGQFHLVAGRRPCWRLLNMLGGYLKYYGSYSTAQIGAGFPYTYGGRPASDTSEIAKAKLYVTFGNNPAVTRGSGGGKTFQLQCAKEAGGARTIIFDPIYTDTALGKEDEWVAIRPGTDAAVVEAMAYVLITENLVDQPFLDTYCVGFDAKTLPAGAPKGSDYKSYILGQGADKLPKTPAWASKITGIPTETIVRIAREIGTTKPVFISQGWGPQRQANGEQTSRAIAMLPILTGNVGLPGTNTGEAEGNTSLGEVGIPIGTNPVKATIPVFLWTDAITRGAEMSAKRDGIRGVDQLKTPIKFIWNYGGNTLINQHSDTNRTHKILQDDSQCEFIVVIDNQMTPSARYADILLPDVMNQEGHDLVANGSSNGDQTFLVAMQQAVKPRFEEKTSYEMCRELAKRFGLEEKFTEGKTQEQWVEWCYEETRKKHPELPVFAEFWKQGVAKLYNKRKSKVALDTFRADPEKNKLKTPSGKIEIYSERLAKIAAEWDLPKGDVISPLPQYVTTFDSHLDPLAKKYPLQAFGLHGQGRTHSTYHNVPWLRELHPDLLLINPVDAAKRGVKNGDKVQVFNDRGVVELPAKVSPRIMPGVVSFPQGAWYSPNAKGIDTGACINTLTTHRPSPLAKGNPQHTNLVEVRKV